MFDPKRICMRCMAELPAAGAECPCCGARNADTRNQPHQLACGTILNGKFLLGSALGEGGFGITYVGWDISLHIKVAVKEYYPEGCLTRDPANQRDVVPIKGIRKREFSAGLTRFLEEARALARFSGEPNIVNVREFFLENETAYIVMDFVEGRTLKGVARERGRIPSREVLAVFRPLMDTLAHIHSEGLIHRDISPDNIILTPAGKAVLIDFGAAKRFVAESSMSVTLKPGYSPPEQYFKKGEQGPWTDVYALCATMYRLTTGRKPPPSLDILAGADTLTPPNERGADFTPQQQKTLLKGMAIEKDMRIQNMDELREGLYKGISGERGSGARPSVRFGIWAEAHKKQFLLAAAALTIALAALLTLTVRRLTENHADQDAALPDESPSISAGTAAPSITATAAPAITAALPNTLESAETTSHVCAMAYLMGKYPSPPNTVEIAANAVTTTEAEYSYAVQYADAEGGIDGILLLTCAPDGEWTVAENRTKPAPEDAQEETNAPDEEPVDETMLKYPGTVTSNVLLIRTEPDATSAARATLNKGDVVDLRRRVDEFYYIYSPQFTVHGYVLAKYIETDYAAALPYSAFKTPTPKPSPTPDPDVTPTPMPGWKNIDPPQGTEHP